MISRSQDIHKTAFENHPYAAIIIERTSANKYAVITFNKAAIYEGVFGQHALDSLEGRDLCDLFDAEANSRLITLCGQIMDSGKPASINISPNAWAGSNRVFKVHCSPLSKNRMMLVFSEEPARTSSAPDRPLMLETILEGTMAGYWDWFIRDDSEYLSPTFKSMFGYADHELPSRPDTWEQIIHPDDLQGVLDVYDLHVASFGKIPFENEVRYYHKDGSIVWVFCRGKVIEWDEEGNPIRMIGCHVDITPMKQAHEALMVHKEQLEQVVLERTSALESTNKRMLNEIQYRKQAELHVKRIVDTAVDAIITIDEIGTIESFNPAAERIFGYAASEVMHRNVNTIMPMPYQDLHIHNLCSCTKPEDEQVFGIGCEVEGRHKNGHLFPIEISISEFEVNGETRFTGIIRDITERKRLEHIKDEFVSIVSHELRTPLTSINGSLGAIVAGTVGEMPEIALNMVGIAQRNCTRLVRLINDLLDIQKMEAGKFEIHKEQINLIELLERAIESNIGFAREHQVELKLATDVTSLPIEVDQDRILQIMTNLLSNAAKFSPAESSVMVTVEVNETVARVRVIDSGSGIPDEFKESIFQKFSQVDTSMQRSKGGTGLGLSISKRIVELHGGAIGFESEADKRTVFYFELPCLPELVPVF